jgi:ribosomal protein S18 acetylase RimI-like enzyme
VGWCDIIRNPHEGFRHVGRLGMGILPDYRGRGLGKQLAIQTIRAARQVGMERIELEVFASNGVAIALYRALGFVTEGTKRHAWSSQDLVDALSMRLVSRFELLRTHAAEMTVAAR